MSRLMEKCSYCNSTKLLKIPEPVGMHWGSLHCENCKRYLGWLQNPIVTAQFEDRQSLIQQAFKSKRLTSWEVFFLKNIQEKRHLSPKQKEKYQQIIERHGIKIPAFSDAG